VRASKLRVVLIKPSKYNRDGWVERFRWGCMPNSTLPYMRSLTPDELDGVPIETFAIDEYVQTDLRYLDLLEPEPGVRTVLALVGAQSHQFQRSLDLAAYALERGALAVIGGPHPMTCDTSVMHGSGTSFALSEGERIWEPILRDAIVEGELRPVYGGDARWQEELTPPALPPPAATDLRRYASRMLGIYPARGCPYRCNFCSIIKIAGHQVRSQPVATTIESLKAAQKAGVRAVFFTSDNFNKYPEAAELLQAMIDERIRIPFFVQCDLQLHKQDWLVELLGRAGCFQMFLGVESFDRETLRAAGKYQNHPDRYRDVLRLCREHGITTTFANILGFPQDDERRVLEHLEILREVGPEMASFYTLTPLPGTEQYAEFMEQGLIDEPNLDRFDASCLVFRHPNLTAGELQDLVYRCYREFFSTRDSIRKGLAALRRTHAWTRGAMFTNVLAHSLLSRAVSGDLSRRIRGRGEPSLSFAGGVGRRKVDRVEAYLPLRRATYGFELAPLPDNLSLSSQDEEINRRAKLFVRPPEAVPLTIRPGA
jgi:radical SAM superfamily enzyme YgiQ (UPF0313 family)